MKMTFQVCRELCSNCVRANSELMHMVRVHSIKNMCVVVLLLNNYVVSVSDPEMATSPHHSGPIPRFCVMASTLPQHSE